MPRFIDSGDNTYVPSEDAEYPIEDNEEFFLWQQRRNRTPVPRQYSGRCHYCGVVPALAAWVRLHILCLQCAELNYGAPHIDISDSHDSYVNEDIEAQEDPRAYVEEIDTFANESDSTQETAEMPTSILTTKYDKDFDPELYKRHDGHTGTLDCVALRCRSGDRAIRPRTPFFFHTHGARGYLCVPCFEALSERFKQLPPRVKCSRCRTRFPEESLHPTVYDGPTCEDCIRNYFYRSPLDKGWVTAGQLVNCQACPAQFSPTGTAIPPARASDRYANGHWFTHGGKWYATRAHADHAAYGRDEGYARSHLQSCEGRNVFGYGTNVLSMKGWPERTHKDSLCLGIELEMQPNSGHDQEDVTEALGTKYSEENPYILCHDGSLGDSGVEMITLPYTLADHKSDKYMNWTDVLTRARAVAKSGKGTTACGMHIHINRRALSSLQIGKMLVIVNAPEMQRFICCISQRGDKGYCSRNSGVKIVDGKKIGVHRDALHVSGSKGTCELRIFKGNLRYERVMKNLEFAEALCFYAKDQSMQKLTDPRLFNEWIQERTGQYPNLAKFLKEHYKYRKGTADAARIEIDPVEGDY
jgi:hypothetical protein